jgi:hypothetical protein
MPATPQHKIAATIAPSIIYRAYTLLWSISDFMIIPLPRVDAIVTALFQKSSRQPD